MCWPSNTESGCRNTRMTEARVTKPGWRTLDHHLPYQNGLGSSARGELVNPLPWSLCSVPLLPHKNLSLHWDVQMEMVEMVFETWVSHLLRRWALKYESLTFPGDGLCDMSPHIPSRCFLKCGYPIYQMASIWKWTTSFTSALAPRILAFIAAGSWTCFSLHNYIRNSSQFFRLITKIKWRSST